MANRLPLKVVLIVVGVLFVAAIYPLVAFFARDPGVPMIMSIYVTLGFFLLLASREPSAHRSLIAFAGWANVAHASVMTVQAYRHIIESRELVGVAVFFIVGLLLIAITPKKQAERETSAKAA